MKKYLVLLLALFLTLAISGRAYCAEGDEFSTTSFRIDGNGEMWYQALNETVTTSDTITAAESGKVFFVRSQAGSPAVFTLPTADEGLVYTFIAGNTAQFDINPSGTETIYYLTLSAGDAMRAPATVGASATLFASDDSVWFATTSQNFTDVN